MIYRSSDIYKLLKHSAISDDCVTFKKWWGQEISLAQCLEEFRKNNDVPDDVEISLRAFKVWLRSEGWY